MELNILHAIQSIRTPELDSVMVLIFNTIVGSKGQFWIYLGCVLLLIPKTRKCGACVLLSYLMSYFLADNILKELIARPRPFTVDDSVDMIVSRSTSYSCPSVHSALAFACATAIYMYNKSAGIITLVFAGLVGFSRLYFFVHYPTDVLFGAVFGAFVAWCVYKLMVNVSVKRKTKK